MTAQPAAEQALSYQGHYAGSVTRLLAFLADAAIVTVLFSVTGTLIAAAISVTTPWSVQLSRDDWWVLVLYFLWWALYLGNSWMLRGRSPGMSLLGLGIVRADGADLDRKHALIRLMAFPLGFLTLGLGFLGIVFGRTHQALYDRIAKTAVVYSWDAEGAKLRAIAKRRQRRVQRESAVRDPSTR